MISQNSEYICCSDIEWAVETDGIMLFQKTLNKAIKLEGPDSALWDFLTRKIPAAKITAMMAAIQNLNTNSAEQWIATKIKNWLEIGLIKRG